MPGFEAAASLARAQPCAGRATRSCRRVRLGGIEGRFDDLAGRGFLIITRNNDPAAALPPDDLDYWRSLGGSLVRINDAHMPASGDALVDIEGRYGRLTDEYGCDVIVKRPDYYIYGACPALADLPGLIADLRDQLTSGTR